MIRVVHLPLVVILLTCACDGGTKKSVPSASNGPSESGTPVGPAKTVPKDHYGEGVVRGVVRFEGQRPAAKAIPMSGDTYCQHAPQVVPPKHVVAEDGGVPWVFVYVKKGIDGEYTVPSEPAVLDQQGCMYAPHVFGIRVGQPLEILNSDNTAHNVNNLASKNERFNIPQPQKNMKTVKTFDKPEIMIKFKCDIHGWMDAYAGVMKHPFFAVTDENGKYEIGRLPPGTYEIEAWHELWGKRVQSVTIGDAEEKELSFTFSKS